MKFLLCSVRVVLSLKMGNCSLASRLLQSKANMISVIPYLLISLNLLFIMTIFFQAKFCVNTSPVSFWFIYFLIVTVKCFGYILSFIILKLCCGRKKHIDFIGRLNVLHEDHLVVVRGNHAVLQEVNMASGWDQHPTRIKMLHLDLCMFIIIHDKFPWNKYTGRTEEFCLFWKYRTVVILQQ